MTNEPNYRPVQLHGSGADSSSVWSVLQSCIRCGVVVGDIGVHDQWHEEQR